MKEKNFDFVIDGVERINFDNISIHETIKRIEKNFLLLIKEPEAYRKLWEFDVQPYPPKDGKYDPDMGLIERSGHNHKDHKFFLHDKNRTLRTLLELRGVNYDKHHQLLFDMEILQTLANTRVLAFAKQLDKRFPGKNFADGIRKAAYLNTLRLIAYSEPEKTQKEQIIARGHTDRDAITMHLYESSPGLKLRLHDGSEYQYEQSDGYTVVFPGKKLQAATGGTFEEVPTADGKTEIIGVGGDIKATYHYVETLPFAPGMKYRVSMVYFSHIPNTEVPHMK